MHVYIHVNIYYIHIHIQPASPGQACPEQGMSMTKQRKCNS